MNSGIDEIIEATTSTDTDGGEPDVSRFLVKFNQTEILDVVNNKATGSIAAYLRVFMAKVEGLGQETTLFCFPVSGSWQNGTGKYLDNPQVTRGKLEF